MAPTINAEDYKTYDDVVLLFQLVDALLEAEPKQFQDTKLCKFLLQQSGLSMVGVIEMNVEPQEIVERFFKHAENAERLLPEDYALAEHWVDDGISGMAAEDKDKGKEGSEGEKKSELISCP